MKCKTVHDIRADVGCFPKYVSKNSMGRDIIASGTVICRDEFPLADCVSMVLNGLAVPFDDECRNECNLSAVQLAQKVEAMQKMLHPEEEDESEFDDEEDAGLVYW